jgi:hypothetical protein
MNYNYCKLVILNNLNVSTYFNMSVKEDDGLFLSNLTKLVEETSFCHNGGQHELNGSVTSSL